jgi:hypothetical protein
MEVVVYTHLNKNYEELVLGKSYTAIRETMMDAYILEGYYGAFSKIYFTNVKQNRNKTLSVLLKE